LQDNHFKTPAIEFTCGHKQQLQQRNDAR